MSFCTNEITTSQHTAAYDHAFNKIAAERKVVKFVQDLGIRTNLKGYNLLIFGICRCMEEPNLSHHMTKGLYPCIAKHYGITAINVERNIRAAIENAYNTNPKRIQAMFYYNVGKPCISEVVTLAIEKIMRGID